MAIGRLNIRHLLCFGFYFQSRLFKVPIGARSNVLYVCIVCCSHIACTFVARYVIYVAIFVVRLLFIPCCLTLLLLGVVASCCFLHCCCVVFYIVIVVFLCVAFIIFIIWIYITIFLLACLSEHQLLLIPTYY